MTNPNAKTQTASWNIGALLPTRGIPLFVLQNFVLQTFDLSIEPSFTSRDAQHRAGFLLSYSLATFRPVSNIPSQLLRRVCPCRARVQMPL